MSYDPEQAKMEYNRRKLQEKWTGGSKSTDSEPTHFVSHDDAKHNPGRVKPGSQNPSRQP